MADMRPKLVFVRDGLGRMAAYLHECVGQDAIISHFGPRYQVVFIRGEPCTIFFDKEKRYFLVAPLSSKQEFADRPGQYDHIIDLDWMTADNYVAPAAAEEQLKHDDKAEEVTKPRAKDKDPDEAASTRDVTDCQTKKIFTGNSEVVRNPVWEMLGLLPGHQGNIGEKKEQTREKTQEQTHDKRKI